MSFCASCGAALNSPDAFCPSCGAKASQPVSQVSMPTAPPAVLHPVVAAKTGSPMMKILLVVGVLLVCGLGTLAYVGYWAKNKMQAAAAAHGITLPTDGAAKADGSLSSGGGATASKRDGPILDACSLISQEEADAVLGEPTKMSDHEKDDRFSSHCHYVAVEEAHAANGFGVQIHNDEDANEARSGLAIKKGIYSNVSLYTLQELSGIGDGGFLAMSKAPEGEAFQSGLLAAMVAHQQIVMMYKGAKDVEILVSYFGKERSTDGLKILTKRVADQI